MQGQTAMNTIEKHRKDLWELSSKIWANPEGAYQEYKACEWLCEYLEKAGFKVEKGVSGVPTAFKATWGSGKPVMGFLAEFDSLPGLSQCQGSAKKPVEGHTHGHACGHNLLGVANVAGAIGLKAEMEEKKLAGTIIIYGTPAEEVLTGKVFMARGGAFDGLDFSIAYHPGTSNTVSQGTMTGLNSFKLHFHGRSAHAGGAPHEGRSALDAIELTNVGINYLREHVPSEIRMHYMIESGGTAPNIVPGYARAWYMVRALSRPLIDDVYKRIINIANGAALMTDCRVEVEFLGGCYPTLNNKVLSGVVQESLESIKMDELTAEELKFAAEINASEGNAYERTLAALKLPEGTHVATGVTPPNMSNSYGSTDVGDIQHIAPGAFFTTASYTVGTLAHSWQATACSGSSIGEKAMIYGGKVLAASYLKVLENPELLEKAKAEFKESTNGKEYACPIGPEIKVPFTE